MGWVQPDFGRAHVILAPSPEGVTRLVRSAPRDTIHILGGYRGYRVGPQALQECLASSARVGLMAEAGDISDRRRVARLLLWRAERLRYGQRFDFILAMGQLGVRWFARCGYAEERIFPYGYFTEPPLDVCDVVDDPGASDCIELVYVGQCILTKRIDIALRSLAFLKSRGWRLTIMGEGPEKEGLQRLASQLQLSGQIAFRLFGPKEEVYRLLRQADALVLPSRYDGWGVVVNEALLCGVPVICTDRCGASDLLRSDWRGSVVKAGSVDELAAVLNTFVERGKRSPTETARIRAWSGCIYGESAAGYLIGVLEHVYNRGPRPVPPWYAG